MKRDIFQEARAEPKKEKGAPIPLLDKLVDLHPEESQEFPPKLFYNKEELIQSVEQEVFRILNTRSTAKYEEFENLIGSKENIGLVQLYGLADFSQFDATNKGHHSRIAKLCQTAIEIFEPRLKEVKVSIHEFDKQTQSLQASIAGRLAIPQFQQEITFPMTISV